MNNNPVTRQGYQPDRWPRWVMRCQYIVDREDQLGHRQIMFIVSLNLT